MNKLSYQEYLQTEHWKVLRLKVIRVYRTCVLCNADKDLRVHHRHYDSLGEEDIYRDVALLCNRCHNRYEYSKKKRPQRSKPKKKKKHVKQKRRVSTNTTYKIWV